MTNPKLGTVRANLAAEIEVIKHRAGVAEGKAEKYFQHHRRRSEHADRIADWVAHRLLVLTTSLRDIEEFVKAAQPFARFNSGDETIQLTVKTADVKRLREALARIGEVP